MEVIKLCRLDTPIIFIEARVDFFFFQAEDGIRDLYVTGVQTCALPISLMPQSLEPALVGGLQQFGMSASRLSVEIDKRGGPVDLRCIFRGMAEETDNQLKRSEERRGGKDRRSGESLHQLHEKRDSTSGR